MNTSHPERPRAHRVWFAGQLILVELNDGRVVSSRYDRFSRLAAATAAQRMNWEIVGRGIGIHWPDLDEDLSTDGLLRDAVSVSAARKKAG
jgi:YD repeat-containing protein